MQITRSTWQVLGLSVAAGYTALGLFEILIPARAAEELFAVASDPGRKEHTEPSATAATASPAGGAAKTVTMTQTQTQQSELVSLLLPLLGARDLSFAAALFSFGYAGQWREFGTVVLAGTILCAADVVAVWRSKGRAA
jgi:hypothetical protein